MVNIKAFTALVLVAVGSFVVIMSSLAANDQDAPSTSSQRIFAKNSAVIDDAGDEPGAVDLAGDHLPLMVRRYACFRRTGRENAHGHLP
jgi:hypothetical protein